MSQVEIRFNMKTGAFKLDVLDGQGEACIGEVDDLIEALGSPEVIEEEPKDELSYTDIDGGVAQGT